MRSRPRFSPAVLFALVLLGGCALLLLGSSKMEVVGAVQNASASNDPRLAKGYRFERDRWIYVHLEGSPAEIGFQHGYLLASEIQDGFNALKFQDTRRTKRDWNFYRQTAHDMMWPKLDPEYQQELQGISDGLKAHGVNLDVDDVTALNAFEEISDYYIPWLNKRDKVANAPRLVSPGNCSAFIATGSYTKDHQIVIAHNAWTGVLPGARWRIVFDIVPTNGNRVLMDGFPGVITSDDDFGVNSNGMMVTETTITLFNGFDPKGTPEFMRSRKALQYANSIDEYVKMMVDNNNGGYANDWLVGDRKTGEIAQLELGLKHWKVWRTKDGYFAGSNWARDPELIKDETDNFNPNDKSSSANARRARWDELMQQYKGKIDVTMAEQFLSDHHDTFTKQDGPDERTLCGHVETSPRGVKDWEWDPYYPGGAVQGKATDSIMAAKMTFVARRGHPCGKDFVAADFLKQHPEYAYEKQYLPDMQAGPWSTFASGDRK